MLPSSTPTPDPSPSPVFHVRMQNCAWNSIGMCPPPPSDLFVCASSRRKCRRLPQPCCALRDRTSTEALVLRALLAALRTPLPHHGPRAAHRAPLAPTPTRLRHQRALRALQASSPAPTVPSARTVKRGSTTATTPSAPLVSRVDTRRSLSRARACPAARAPRRTHCPVRPHALRATLALPPLALPPCPARRAALDSSARQAKPRACLARQASLQSLRGASRAPRARLATALPKALRPATRPNPATSGFKESLWFVPPTAFAMAPC
jgi:hypothetical protein